MSLTNNIREALGKLTPKNLLVSIRETFGDSGRYYRFGNQDNAPNLIMEACNDSPTARICIDKLNQFVFGGGFEKEELNEIETSPNVKLSHFTRGLIEYLNYSDGFVIQHKFDKAGRSARKYIIPLQYVRKRYQGDFIYREGLGDEAGTYIGNFTNIIVPNWETIKKMSPSEIRSMIDGQVKKYGEQLGAFQYCYIPRVGQLYDKYPVPNHFSALPTLRADAGLSLAQENAVANSFKPNFVVSSPVLDRNVNDEDGQSEYSSFVAELNRFMSPDGSDVVLLESNNSEKIKITPLNNPNRLKEAVEASLDIRKSVAGSFSVPPILIGIDTAGKLGDNQELVNKVKLFNLGNEDKRNVVYRALAEMYSTTEKEGGEKWTEEDFVLKQLDLFDYLPPDVIKALTPEQASEIYNLPEVEGENTLGPQTPSAEAGAEGINDAFTNLSGRQLQSIQRTVRKFNKGEINKAQASQLLMSGFGMTEEQADVWLIEESEE